MSDALWVLLYVAAGIAAACLAVFVTLVVMGTAVGLFLSACEWVDDRAARLRGEDQ